MLTKKVWYCKKLLMLLPTFRSIFVFIPLIMGASTIATTAQAGPGTSGGGSGVACVDDVFAPGTNYRDFFKLSYQPSGEPKFVYVQDYFQSKLPTNDGRVQASIFDRTDLSEDKAISLFLKEIGLFGSPADNLFTLLTDNIGPIASWTDSPLETYPDAELAYALPKGCKYVQLAHRQDGMMFGDGEWIRKMKPVQRAVLRIHEALYLSYYQSAEKKSANIAPALTSVTVRQFMGAIARVTPITSDEYYLRSAKIREMLTNSFFTLLEIHDVLADHPFESDMLEPIFVEGTTLSKGEPCFDRLNEIMKDMIYAGIPFDINHMGKTFEALAKNERYPLCVTEAYLLSSPWNQAFKTIIGAIRQDIEYTIGDFNKVSASAREQILSQKKGENDFIGGDRHRRFLIERKPYFEKMVDYDAELYQATLDKLTVIYGPNVYGKTTGH